MSVHEHYEVLGCTKESSQADLKAAYRKLVLRHHPDKVDAQKDKAARKFQEIEEAWKVLRDPASKKKYDAQCRQAELESQSVLVYATITMDEMEVTADEDTLSYQCRCGSYYLVCREDLLEKNRTLHIPCQECTFVVVVET